MPATYVPILRPRPAELRALRSIRQGDQGRLLPLIVIETQDEAVKTAEAVGTSAQLSIVDEYRPVSAYVQIAEPDAEASGALWRDMSTRHEARSLIPVVWADHDPPIPSAVQTFAKEHSRGLCCRVSGSGLRAPRAAALEIAKNAGLPPEIVDVLLDLGEISQAMFGLREERARSALSDLAPLPWRRVIVAGGSMPRSLTFVGDRAIRRIPRLEAALFRRVRSCHDAVSPIYGDYAIVPARGGGRAAAQHEGGSKVVPLIRYTRDNDWVIYRGRRVRDDPRGWAQYVDEAAQLVHDDEVYRGAGFSAGDRSYGDAVRMQDHHVPAWWVTADVNHHFAEILSGEVARADL